MPIKQVTCCKCNQLVNKAQTYSIGSDQRACRKHEGVVERKGELEAQRIRKAQAAVANMRRRNENFAKSGHPDWSGDSTTPKCWLCMCEGLRQDEYFQRILIEMEKAQLAPGDKTLMEILFPKIEKRCIFVLAKESCASILKYIREDFQMLVQVSGVVSICGPCCGNFKIDPLPKQRDPKLLAACAIAYQLINQAVDREITKTEIAKAN